MWVKEISASDTYDLRHTVLRADFPRNCVHYEQDQIEGSFHLGVFEGEILISVGSFYPKVSFPIEIPPTKKNLPFQLRGMASLPEFRGLGAGTLLLNTAKFVLDAKGASLLWFNAREKAFPFYERLGYKVIGDLFLSYSVPHKIMFRVF